MRRQKTCEYQVRNEAANRATPCFRSVRADTVGGHQHQERARHAEGEVEHAHRHEPVVDRRPSQKAGDNHPASIGELQEEVGQHKCPGGDDRQREELRGQLVGGEATHEVEKREERRVGLEEAVRDELGVPLRMLYDRERREVVRQVLERRHLGEGDRPSGQDEQHRAGGPGEASVAHALELLAHATGQGGGPHARASRVGGVVGSEGSLRAAMVAFWDMRTLKREDPRGPGTTRRTAGAMQRPTQARRRFRRSPRSRPKQ